MELSLQTFLWLRDKGGLSSQSAVPSQYNTGMMAVTADGLQEIALGVPLVRVLHHYCCNRFDVPSNLQAQIPSSSAPVDAKSKTPSGMSSTQLIAARHHNWSVIKHIARDTLAHALPDEQIELIQKQGDALEALLVVKCVFDLVKNHRGKERQQKEQHKSIATTNVHVTAVRQLLETKSVAPSKKVIIAVAQNSTGSSPVKRGPSPSPRYLSPTKSLQSKGDA